MHSHCQLTFLISFLVLFDLPADGHVANPFDEPKTSKTRIEVEPSAKIADTPEVEADGLPALQVRVLDAEDDRPIKKFVLIAGVEVNDELVDKKFVAKHGKDMIVNWQSHTIREGANGEYVWPMRTLYRKLAIRVEAEGYLPHRFKWIDKSRGSQTIVFRLKKDKGIKGRVVLPNGKGAAGAEIAIIITSRSVRLNDTSFGFDGPKPKKIRERWQKGVVVKADEDGRFLLPTETDPSAFVIAIGRFGTRQIAFDEFKTSRKLELEKWGRLEGTVIVGDKPTFQEPVSVYDARPLSAPYPREFVFYYEVKSNMAGKFVIPNFPPGLGEASLPDFITPHDPSGGFSFLPTIPEGAIKRFHVRSGETTKIVIGGKGLGKKPVKPDGKLK